VQETGIGKTVNSYRKHRCKTVGNFARHLVAKWKQLVQRMTEAISDTQCVPAARDDTPMTADVKEKALVVNCESEVDEQHLGTSSSSSKHKHLSASGTKAASKRHSSSTVEHIEVVKQDVDDVVFRKQCLQTEVSATSLTLPRSNDQHGDGTNSSQNKSPVQRSAYRSAFTEHQKMPAGNLLVKNLASTSHKSRHEKHSRLNKPTTDNKRKGECHSGGRVPAKTAKYKSNKTESQDMAAECFHTNNNCLDTERVVCELGREVSNRQVETDPSKSLRKTASKTKCTVVHKGPEKKSSGSVPSSASTHSFGCISKDQNQADLKTFTADVDESKHNGLTFEQMLNYDNRGIIVKKNTGGGVFSSSKSSKVPKSVSQKKSHVSPAITKQAGKPDSGHVSKRTSCLLQTLHNKKSAESDELDRSRLIRHPVIPRPESQVGTEFLKYLCSIFYARRR